MTIIALNNQPLPNGEFKPSVTVIGATREECIAALQLECQFAEDIGASQREDGQEIYTMIGGSIR